MGPDQWLLSDEEGRVDKKGVFMSRMWSTHEKGDRWKCGWEPSIKDPYQEEKRKHFARFWSPYSIRRVKTWVWTCGRCSRTKRKLPSLLSYSILSDMISASTLPPFFSLKTMISQETEKEQTPTPSTPPPSKKLDPSCRFSAWAFPFHSLISNVKVRCCFHTYCKSWGRRDKRTSRRTSLGGQKTRYIRMS